MNKTEQIIEACRAIRHYPYQCKSSYPDGDAVRNLEGRTHYADADTLKYFPSFFGSGTGTLV